MHDRHDKIGVVDGASSCRELNVASGIDETKVVITP